MAACVTFATHQCDFPLLAEVVVVNDGDRDLGQLTLHLHTEPPITAPRHWTIDHLPAHGELPLADRRVELAAGALDSLTERMRCTLTLELRQDERVLAAQRSEVLALARNEWGGATNMPELLAAFVQPNDPAVPQVLARAAAVLARAGRPDGLDGYQAKSRQRSWELAAAIWASVQGMQLVYAVPPASFGLTGQKIRAPSVIAQHGLATCLDLALLFAAAAEQAGLYPVVVCTEGHALCGVWLQPQCLPSLCVHEAMELRKAVAAQELILIETTLATDRQDPPLTRALAAGAALIGAEHEAAFGFALDIRQARGRGILPLAERAGPDASPQRAAPVDGAALELPPPLPPFELDPAFAPEATTPAERLERWKRSLLDLSKRNRLLNLRPSATALQIFCPDPAAVEDRLAMGGKLSIVAPPERRTVTGAPDPELRLLRTGEAADVQFARAALERNELAANVAAEQLDGALVELFRKARNDFEEGGSNTLFLALGMLRWSPLGDSAHSYRAPLVLLPVRLERASARSKPRLAAHDDDAVFNLTLLELLRQDFAIGLPELESDLPADEHGVDVARIWELVRQRVRGVAGFEVVPDVVLSTFSFAKYLMWKDLADRTDALKRAPFVRHAIDTPREPYPGGATFMPAQEVDRTIHPRDLLAPLHADSSQVVAIHASGRDGDFVLEGPPGTGKSETIGNIIVHNLGLGRRVLFVSEKMAALEVVYRRLQGCGLGDFCLELHSAKASKSEVLAQLDRAWQARGAHSPVEWQERAEQLAALRQRLNDLVADLHAPGPGGISPRQAIGRCVRFAAEHRWQLDWPRDPTGAGHAPTPAAAAELTEVATRIGREFARLRGDDLAAFDGIGCHEWSHGWVAELTAAARALAHRIVDLHQQRAHLGTALELPAFGESLPQNAAAARLAELLPLGAGFDLAFAARADGKATLDQLADLTARLQAYRDQRGRLPWPVADERLAQAPLPVWVGEFAATQRRWWPFRLLARRRLRAAMHAGLGLDPRAAAAPEQSLDLLVRLQHAQGELDRCAAGLPPGTPWRGLDSDLAVLHATVQHGRRLRETLLRLAEGGDLEAWRQPLQRAFGEQRERLEAGLPLAAAAAAFASAHAAFVAGLADFDRSAQPEPGGARDLAALQATAQAVLAQQPRLNAWCAWNAARREAHDRGLASIVPALLDGTVPPDQAAAAWQTAYARWLAPILVDARPSLRRFSAVGHEDAIAQFRRLDADLAGLAAGEVRARLSQGTPQKQDKTREPGYSVLARELQKRTRHKPVRQLVTEMGPALLRLTPCLLMSPLSVAQFLPADQEPFDLVVFDEASQITVPDAIGAIARGRRCIVVGDPRQMPPTRFFERSSEADDSAELPDLESILDEALAATVPHHRLTGHYRSRHESLICFSNHAYYGGRLVTYPSADTRQSAVGLVRVDGVYARGTARTNEIEARALVAEVVRRLRDPRLCRLSIGIVTMNSEQQRLIENLLDDERRRDVELERFFAADSLEPIFVKNLETVQGDQRDVILLSIGYGPSAPGARDMPMNFGPLNREGGERRWNVAITRATTEVVVFASFDAAMIDTTRTKARAVADLKQYLEFAERGPAAIPGLVHAVGGDAELANDFEAEVCERLRQRGWTVHAQIGVSRYRIDLGIVHPEQPGRFLAGVECDGASYHRSPSARDRDRVRQMVLERLGWRLFRIWSTDFFTDAPAAIAELDRKLRAVLEADREAAATGAPGQPAAAAIAVTAVTAAAAAAAPATPAPVEAFDRNRFHAPEYRERLRALAAERIDREGPITCKRLCDLLARLHGMQRTGRQILDTVQEAIGGLRPTSHHGDERVLWPAGATPSATVKFRGLEYGIEARDWAEVPHPEKLGLVQELLATSAPDIARAVADRLGYARVTASLRAEVARLQQPQA